MDNPVKIAKVRKNKIKKPLVVQAYELLKEKIVTLEFAPGMKLEEQGLMEKLKLGRTPVHEAVKMLISEGLVVSYGSNSTYVKELTLKSAKDLLLLLYRLGDVIFDLTNLDDDFGDTIKDLKTIYLQMDESINKGDVPAFARLNADFHKKLAKIANNEYLDDLLERLYCEEVRLAFVLSLSLGKTKGTSFSTYYDKIQEQHRKLIDFLKIKDFETLKKIYIAHLALGQKRLSIYFAGNIEKGG